jgi:signal transduction histidine kinase
MRRAHGRTHRRGWRLAKILHDHLQQSLVGAKLRIAALGMAGNKRLGKVADDIERQLEECLAISTSLTAELSPPILHEAGLVAALEWLVRLMGDKHGLRVELVSNAKFSPLPEDLRVLVFESVRELLFNVVKHSGVRQARVQIQSAGREELKILVIDHGKGFDPGQSKFSGHDGSGFGLFSIRERLELMGGRIEIESEPGRGTRVTLFVPKVSIEVSDRFGALPSPPQT